MAGRIHGDAARTGELRRASAAASLAAVAAPHGQEPAVGVEFLDPIVAVVGHVEVAGRVGGQPTWVVEFAAGPSGAAIATVAAEAGLEAAVGTELLDAIARAVGNVEVAQPVGGHAAGMVELPRTESGGSVAAIAAERRQEAPAGGELLDAVVVAVSDIHVTAQIDGQVVGAVERSFCAPRGAPAQREARCGLRQGRGRPDQQ